MMVGKCCINDDPEWACCEQSAAAAAIWNIDGCTARNVNRSDAITCSWPEYEYSRKEKEEEEEELT